MLQVRKKKLMKITAIVFIFLLVCTFLSRTVETISIPKVEVEEVKSGMLTTIVKTQGEIHFSNKQEILFDVPVTITNVMCSCGQSVNIGDVIFQIDTRELELLYQQKKLAVSTAEKAVYDGRWADSKTRNLLDQELKIAEDELELFASKYPIDGKIVSEVSGVVTSINVMQGAQVDSGEIMAEISDKNSELIAEFALTKNEAENVSYGDVMVHYDVTDFSNEKPVTKKASVKAVLNAGLYDDSSNSFVFLIPLSVALDENTLIVDMYDADISITKSTDIYDYTVPISAIIKNKDQSDAVYILSQRDGLFGTEDYVELVEVEIEEKNATTAAIKSQMILSDTKVVAAWDGVIESGSTVRVVE